VKSVNSTLKLLEFMFSEKKQQLNDPMTMFIFNGSGSGITVDPAGLQWPFPRGLTLFTWVNIQEQIEISNILSIQTGDSSFDISIDGRGLIYTSVIRG
jgi:hypothetical protein